MNNTTDFIKDIYFGEGPRWNDNQLWFSDMFDKTVSSVDVSTGNVNKVCSVEGGPSGIGWLPDGRLLVVSMKDRKVMRLEKDGSLLVHADLSDIATHDTNDMVVSKSGYAYVGNMGFDLQDFIKKHGREAAFSPNTQLPTAKLAVVSPSGEVSVGDDGIVFPNGSVISDNGKTLVVAETFARRLTAFDVNPDGSLSNRRIWADLGDVTPDGICLDAEGAIWIADSGSAQAVRVAEGGEVLSTVKTSQRCFALALGGENGKMLYCCTAPSSVAADLLVERKGKIEQIQVDVPCL